MLRAGLLWLSEQPHISRFVRRNGLAQKLASRFVAGETVDSAVAALRQLNAAGITATLDLIERAHAQSHVSVKLTQMGLDIDEGACVKYVRAIAVRARDRGSFMRIDMEGSAYTERTLRLFK